MLISRSNQINFHTFWNWSVLLHGFIHILQQLVHVFLPIPGCPNMISYPVTDPTNIPVPWILWGIIISSKIDGIAVDWILGTAVIQQPKVFGHKSAKKKGCIVHQPWLIQGPWNKQQPHLLPKLEGIVFQKSSICRCKLAVFFQGRINLIHEYIIGI